MLLDVLYRTKPIRKICMAAIKARKTLKSSENKENNLHNTIQPASNLSPYPNKKLENEFNWASSNIHR